MTRKHYKALAQVIHGFKYEMTPHTFMHLVWQLGEVLGADNERFDMVRWEDACGLTHDLVSRAKESDLIAYQAVFSE